MSQSAPPNETSIEDRGLVVKGSSPGRTSSRIEAVVLDYGGVLSMPPFEALTRLESELGLGTGVLVDPFRTGDAFAEAELGRASVGDAFSKWRDNFAAEHGVRLDAKRVFGALASAGEVNADMVSLVERLSSTVRLAVLTNNIAEMRDRWRALVPIDLFELVIDSSEVGLRKPDPAIYEVLLARLGLAADQVAFIDDTRPNVDAANALGMAGIEYSTTEQVAAELAELGVST